MNERPFRLDVPGSGSVGAVAMGHAEPDAVYVFAHGAGADMNQPFMRRAAAGLDERRIATLRFQFPYAEARKRRVDGPAVSQATVRAAVAQAHQLWPCTPLFAGGKSFGGRMTSQAQARAPLAGVLGLIFLGFPLHPACRPSLDRAPHLSDLAVPILFVQGTRDALAEVAQREALGQDLPAVASGVLLAALSPSGVGVMPPETRFVQQSRERSVMRTKVNGDSFAAKHPA